MPLNLLVSLRYTELPILLAVSMIDMSLEDVQQQRAAAHFRTQSTRQWLSAYGGIIRTAAITIVFTAIALIFAVDSSRTSSPRRYASALHWIDLANRFPASGMHCDSALGKRRLWVLGIVTGQELCVEHREQKLEATSTPEPGLRFLVVGDWGRDGMCCQRDVAFEMARTARVTKPRFIVSTGDNFYNNGIAHSGDGQVERSWKGVYITPHEELRLPWKMTLGNHDYGGVVEAQKVLDRENAYWQLPDLYYFETLGEGDHKVFIAYLDTNVLYYMQDEFRLFQGELSITYRDNQIAALRKALSESSAKWKIVVGHHPLYSSGENSLVEEKNLKQMRTILLNILKEHHVAAYFSGHEHLMEHLVSEGIHFFISGAGSKVSGVEQELKESVFALGQQGFASVVVRNDTDTLTVRMIDLTGAVVHKVNIPKPTA